MLTPLAPVLGGVESGKSPDLWVASLVPGSGRDCLKRVIMEKHTWCPLLASGCAQR